MAHRGEAYSASIKESLIKSIMNSFWEGHGFSRAARGRTITRL
jgi:hypothetical protein